MPACDGFRNVGTEIEAPPLDSSVTKNCPRPEDFLSSGDWELAAGQMGDALLDCDAARATAVDGYDGLAEAVR